jgi:hypothetical protein
VAGPFRALDQTDAQVPAGSPTRPATSRHLSFRPRSSMILAAFSGVTLRGRPGGLPERVGRCPSRIARIATRTLSDLRLDSNAATEVTTPSRRFRANPALASSASGVER